VPSVSGDKITCPFCGLGCDDLVNAGGTVDTRGCAKAARGFARAQPAPKPHAVNGAPVDLPIAAGAAARLLCAAGSPLFYGLAADLHGVRALLALADRVGGTVDHVNSPALLANAAVARASGWVTATFGEVANRADLILIVGGDPARNFPRFHERLVANATPLYRERAPTIAYLGPREEAPAGATLSAFVAREDLLDALGVLAGLLREITPRRVPDHFAAAPLAVIAERLAAAGYGALVWDVTTFAPGESELAVELLAAMLRELNTKTRCVGVPLGGSENGLGGMQAALWEAGWPLPLGFAASAPQHDPWRFDGRRQIEAGEADLVVWIATLAPLPPPETRVPVIAIVADDVALSAPATVEIRVGIPGLDHGGAVFRSDTVIALPLQATRPSDRPSVAEAAQAILAALGPPS
jgi:formylmethanofuran dehydrogenase subunit B